jgi:tetrapyrrole methylase family protein / MazG family protein
MITPVLSFPGLDQPGVTLLGLGPGDSQLLTRQAWGLLSSAREIYLRTSQHPTVNGFPPNLRIFSFDDIYEKYASFDQVYHQIIKQVLELARRPQGVIYAVPGHPFVAESTSTEISRLAQQEGLPVQVVEGISFIESVFSALGIDPLPQISIVDALELAVAHFPSFPPSTPAVIAQIHSKIIASEVKLTLMEVYPDEYPVYMVHRAGTSELIVEPIPLYMIDRTDHIGLQTTLYVPALKQNSSFEAFQDIIAHLRAPDGCPWDREQTHQTLRTHLLEEAYEVLAALDADDPQAICEELGDLLLQIVLHAQIASEYGEFRMTDIIQGIHNKLVYRHPHVFGDVDLKDVNGILENWERLKASERVANGKTEQSLLDGIALALPALIQAEEYQKRVSRVGFDWSNIQGVVDKFSEELLEVKQAKNPEQRAREIGDLFFAVVNLSRWYELDAENVLREANARFRKRFIYIETTTRNQGKQLSDLSLSEMDAIWEEAKNKE